MLNISWWYILQQPIHIKARKGEIAERVIIAGDPARVEQVSKLLSNVRLVNTNRGFIAYTGEYNGTPISVVVHGIGVPSSILVLEELVMLGAKAIVRLGSCGAMIKGMRIGDVVIPTVAAYYPGGAYYQYLKENVCAPTAPDYDLLKALIEATSKYGIKYYVGPILTSDAFYAEDPEFAKKWASRGVIAVEMECSGLFMLGHMRGVKVAAILLVSDSLVEELGFASAEELREYALRAAKIALEALRSIKI